MLVCYFSECSKLHDQYLSALTYLPVIPRLKFYREFFRAGSLEKSVIHTNDELLVLMCQWARRTKLVKELELISVCECRTGNPEYRIIQIDADGDMVDNPHHSFFNQRLEFLR